MITVINNQSILDIAIQENGNVIAALEIAVRNGISITSNLAPGQQMLAGSSLYDNKEVINYWESKKQNIANGTALTPIKQEILFTNIIEDYG